MNNVFAVFSFLCLLPVPVKELSAPYQAEEKAKKEIKISMNSNNYKDSKKPFATTVIEGFFLQANIRDKYIDSTLDKMPIKNFSFTDKTIDETIQILSIIFSIKFNVQSIGKDKFYFVEPVKK